MKIAVRHEEVIIQLISKDQHHVSPKFSSCEELCSQFPHHAGAALTHALTLTITLTQATLMEIQAAPAALA